LSLPSLILSQHQFGKLIELQKRHYIRRWLH